MRFVNLLIIGAFVAVALLTSSCQSTGYNRARAVERARKFALRRLRDLPEETRAYIRYTPPVLRDSAIFVRQDAEIESKHNIYQTCIIWSPPELEYDIVVFGVSERRLDDWYPNQLILKRFVPLDSARDEATTLSVKYVMNNMLYLSDNVRNRVRFAPPRVVATDFSLYDKRLREMLKEKYSEYQNILKGLAEALGIKEEKKNNYIQTSMVWDTDVPKDKVVVVGIGRANFGGWAPVFSMLMPEKYLNSNTLYRRTAALKAIKFAEYNLKGVDAAIAGVIRVAAPDYIRTDFDLGTDASVKGSTQVQSSIVWKVQRGKRSLVVAGVGEPGFKGWKPFKAVFCSKTDLLDRNISRELATEKASAFALEKLGALSEEMKKLLADGKPKPLRSDFNLGLDNEAGIKGVENAKLVQNSFVWTGKDKDNQIVVSGLGEVSLEGWSPIVAAIRSSKDIEEHNVNVKDAIKRARAYAEDHPANITYKEERRILAVKPKIYETDFNVKAILEKVKGKEVYFAAEPGKLQWSFVWDADEKGRKIVIIGQGKEDMSEWAPEIMSSETDAEVENCIFK